MSKNLKPGLIAGGILAGLFIVGWVFYRYNPADSVLYPPCPFHALTGLHCPGCGSLRAIHQLARGNVITALGLNPLMVISLPFLIYAMISSAKKSITGTPLPTIRLRAKWIWTLLAVIIVYWIARNIPAYPFNLLAP